MQDVFITGVGLIASPGCGGGDFVASLDQRDPGFKPWPEGQHAPTPNALIGVADDYPKEKYFTERQLRLTDRAMVMATCAVGMALEDAGFAALDERDEVATIFGSNRSEHGSTQKFSVPLFSGRPKSLNPAQFPMIARNVACGQVALTLGVRGFSSMVCSGPLASLQAIARGYDLIRRGRTPIALVGGVETLSKFAINHSRHLYPSYFRGDAQQFFGDGLLVPAEGSAMLVLESAEHARRRGATPYARIDGCFSGRLGQQRDGARAEALLSGFVARKGGWRDIGMISASNGGYISPASQLESEMLATLYARHDIAPAVVAPRSWIGEAESVACALQVQAAACALRHGEVPANRCVASNSPIGVNVKPKRVPLAQGDAIVTGFDDALNFTFLRLTQGA